MEQHKKTKCAVEQEITLDNNIQIEKLPEMNEIKKNNLNSDIINLTLRNNDINDDIDQISRVSSVSSINSYIQENNKINENITNNLHHIRQINGTNNEFNTFI